MMEPKRTDSLGFTHVLHAQWTTFRKSRILVVGTVVAALVTVLLGLGYAAGSNDHVSVGCGGSTVCSSSSMPTGELVGRTAKQWRTSSTLCTSRWPATAASLPG